MSDTDDALADQLAYYGAIAGEYDEHTINVEGQVELLTAIDGFRPFGDVLELACGTGRWTGHLLASASSVTAVDGSTEMLDQARRRLGDDHRVEFIHADLFDWRPPKRFDAVVFGFWISHVPDDRFDAFWRMVADALAPGGVVFFFDDHHRTEAELVEGPDSSVVERGTPDGRGFRVVKVPHRPDDLAGRIDALGWIVQVSGAGEFYWGGATRR